MNVSFGKIVDVNDPEKLGRVKVNVFNVHDNIETKHLPWTQVMMPGNTPAISGQGHSVNLQVDSLIVGIFLDSMQQEFMVIGTLPTKTDAKEDNNDRVRSINPHADDPTGEYEPASTFAPVYPYNNVYETGSGHAKEYDDTPGAERIMERHKSGTQYEIDPNGSKVEKIVRDNYQLVVGQDTLEVFGNVRIIVSGQADIAVAKDVNLAVDGKLTADVGGSMVANVTGMTSLISVDDITLKVTDSTNQIYLESTNIKLDGDVNITGDLIVDKTTKTSKSQLVDSHSHTGDSGGSTGNLV
jgi:hypothetical protein